MTTRPSVAQCVSRFPAVAASIAAARDWARACVQGFGDPLRQHRIIEAAELLVSELITNAIRHGAGSPVIRLSWNGRMLRIAVSDRGPRWPRMRTADAAEPGGFGIRIVEQLTQRWGVTPDDTGKTVWAELSPHVRPAAT
ncbi:ATP-binding protein [Streptomyces sp. NPDC005574]|uniref:ATP-binding protein n=1 Tax=Streptomyces sp. NPDC005574 TaxID=3156891 RepID=UPI0033A47B96